MLFRPTYRRIHAVILFLITASLTWPVGAMQGGPAQSAERPSTLLVTFRESALPPLETGLPEGAVAVNRVGTNTETRAFLQNHRLREMQPLYDEHVRERRQSRRRGSTMALQTRDRFPKRARRLRGHFAPPDLSRTYLLKPASSDPQALSAVLESLRRDPRVEHVQFEAQYYAAFTPNDPFFSTSGTWQQPYRDLYGLVKTAAPTAWDLHRGQGVLVAVSDSGVDYNHPDIAANMWSNPVNGTPGFDFINNDTAPLDDFGHGTHVAGTLAAAGNNAVGVVGLAWQCKIMAVKGLTANGTGSTSALARGIVWATDRGADIINMSWTGEGSSDDQLKGALAYAHSLGVVLVAASGNNGKDVSGYYPGGFTNVITVAASDANDQVPGWSNFGAKIDVAAPGADILSLQAAGSQIGSVVAPGYSRMSGTSMAAPHVSALAALILNARPTYDNEQVRQAIRLSADPIHGPGFSIYSGYGRINAQKALELSEVPTVFISTPAAQAVLGNSVTVSGSAAGSEFQNYQLSFGSGTSPAIFTPLGPAQVTPVTRGVLGIWDTTALAAGVYTLRLSVATPNRTYTTLNTPLWIDHAPPTGSFLSPAEHATVFVGQPVLYQVAAADDGGIRRVEFYRDGTILMGTVTAAPFEVPIAMTTTGAHRVVVRITDIAGKNILLTRNVQAVLAVPVVAIAAPPDGAVLSGLTTISGTATNALSVDIESDGRLLGTAMGSTTWNFSFNSQVLTNAAHTLTARGLGYTNNSGTADRSVTASNSHGAVYDSTLRVPACANPAPECQTVNLIQGRAALTNWSELNAPNTLAGSACADGTAGGFPTAESVEHLRVISVDGSDLALGKSVRVEVTARTAVDFGNQLDIFYAANAQSPSWVLLKSVFMPSGRTVVTSTFTLTGATGMQAIRAQLRFNGSAVPCSPVSTDERDDIAFHVRSATIDTTPPTAPTSASFSQPTATQLRLSWGGATDNIGLFSYGVDVSTSPGFSGFVPPYANFTVGLSTSAIISGLQPATTYYARLRARDAAGNESPNSITATGVTLPFVLPDPPVITSSLTATALVGVAFTYQITATNNPNTFFASDLPPGLSVNSQSGLISGTPLSTGTASVGLMVFNGSGAAGRATLTLTVVNPSGSACDANGDSSTNVLDVQVCVLQALGITACEADINQDSLCNIIDVQRIANAAIGLACVSP